MEIEEWDEITFEQKPIQAVKMDVPQTPTATFHCILMKCDMKAYHCPDRQLATVTIGITHKRVIDTRFLPCSAGKCVQGRRILRTAWSSARREQRKNK